MRGAGATNQARSRTRVAAVKSATLTGRALCRRYDATRNEGTMITQETRDEVATNLCSALQRARFARMMARAWRRAGALTQASFGYSRTRAYLRNARYLAGLLSDTVGA